MYNKRTGKNTSKQLKNSHATIVTSLQKPF